MSVLVYEIIKSQRDIYPNRVVVPVGYIQTRDMIRMTRIPLDIKSEVNKWVFYCLRRANYDSFAYLNWLQLQNKYTLEFSLQNSGDRFVSHEEFLFKDFLVKEGLQKVNYSLKEENSSKEFYRFVKDVKRKISETRSI